MERQTDRDEEQRGEGPDQGEGEQEPPPLWASEPGLPDAPHSQDCSQPCPPGSCPSHMALAGTGCPYGLPRNPGDGPEGLCTGLGGWPSDSEVRVGWLFRAFNQRVTSTPLEMFEHSLSSQVTGEITSRLSRHSQVPSHACIPFVL